MPRMLCVNVEVRLGREWVRGCCSDVNPFRIRAGRAAIALVPGSGSAARGVYPIAVHRIASVTRVVRRLGRPIARVEARTRSATAGTGFLSAEGR